VAEAGRKVVAQRRILGVEGVDKLVVVLLRMAAVVVVGRDLEGGDRTAVLKMVVAVGIEVAGLGKVRCSVLEVSVGEGDRVDLLCMRGASDRQAQRQVHKALEAFFDDLVVVE
jgi:hypothetical protein